MKTSEELKILCDFVLNRRGVGFKLYSKNRSSRIFCHLVFSRIKFETNQGFKNEIMSGHDELVLIPEEEIDTSDLSENESDVQNTETINDQSVEMVGFFLFFFQF